MRNSLLRVVARHLRSSIIECRTPIRRWRSVISLCCALWALCISAAAQADSIPPFTPNYEAVDQNGVNLVTGGISISQKSLSIGPKDESLSHEMRNIEKLMFEMTENTFYLGLYAGYDNYFG